MQWIKKTIVCCALVSMIPLAALAEGPPAAEPKMPQPGDQLGYSKDESIRRLDPEIRRLLDALLRLYREPGLFTDRRYALSIVGADVNRAQRRWFSRSTGMSEKEATHFEDVFGKQGIFSRPGWRGRYLYDGWRDKGTSWYAEVRVFVDQKIECADSRAIEGYLDLYLETGLRGHVHPLPPERWDRHGSYGSPYALAVSPRTPHLGMIFSNGCLLEIAVYRNSNYMDVNDGNVLN